MVRKPRIGLLLLPKDLEHLGITSEIISLSDEYEFYCIDENVPIADQGLFDIILHKVSDYIKPSREGKAFASRILKEITEILSINRVCLDVPLTVLDLADRPKMFQIMDASQLECNNISVSVPKWCVLQTPQDFKKLNDLNFSYPLICKALCAGEGPGCHAMQLLFNPKQLNVLDVFPCVAQEFKNHGGEMIKIFVFGPMFAIITRPSVRNFPLNGQTLESTDSIRFNSHDVAKVSSRSFLNNYQSGFTEKSSLNGDLIIDTTVARELLRKLSNQIQFTFLGIDLLVPDSGSSYYLVDINYLPSYSGLSNRFELLSTVLDGFLKHGEVVNYWK